MTWQKLHIDGRLLLAQHSGRTLWACSTIAMASLKSRRQEECWTGCLRSTQVVDNRVKLMSCSMQLIIVRYCRFRLTLLKSSASTLAPTMCLTARPIFSPNSWSLPYPILDPAQIGCPPVIAG